MQACASEQDASLLFKPEDKVKLFDLVFRGASQEQWIDWLRPPLEHAAAAGDVDIVKKLVKVGAKVDTKWKGCHGRTALHAAVQGGKHESVATLLKAGGKSVVNVALTGGKKWTPLHYAAFGGHDTIVEMLMFAGASVACVDSFGDTPLHLAASEGYRQVVIALALRGADVNKLNRAKFSPLFVAAIRGHLLVTDALLTAGADPELRCGVNPRTPLEESTCKGHVEVVRSLIQHGVDVNAGDPNDHRATALHLAAYFDHPGAIDVLAVEGGANIEARTTHPDVGWTPLSYAAKQNSCLALNALLRRGARVDAEGVSNNRPLAMACQWLAAGAAGLLLRWGADETCTDSAGRSASDVVGTALSLSEQQDRREEVESLRRMLARAPMDRAWRRRGMLVLCRALAQEMRFDAHRGQGDIGVNKVQAGGGGGAVSRAVVGRRATKSARTVKIEVADNGTGKDIGSGVACLLGGSVEARVVQLTEETLFRKVICFL
ncbi:unnamed protein product [Sphacelaria rigidula]